MVEKSRVIVNRLSSERLFQIRCCISITCAVFYRAKDWQIRLSQPMSWEHVSVID
jgi:hypothetical protein